MVYLWRAVDAEGEVLDVLVQSRAALKLMRKLLKKYGFVPDKLVTDDLKSYAAAASDLGITRVAQQSSGELASTDPAAAHRVQIGEILSATKRVAGEAWPPEAVREVLEAVANDDIDQEFAIGLRRLASARKASQLPRPSNAASAVNIEVVG